MKSPLAWAIGILLAAGLCWLFPPFHVLPLRKAQNAQKLAAFDAAAFAREFWQKKLLPATDRATPATELLAALANDPGAARQRFGRSPGLSGTSYFFVKGSGVVAATEKETIQITLEVPSQPTVELLTGLLFGNIVRDGTGLLNISDFPNSQDFNAISTELNRIVETQVVPALRARAAVGNAIRFTGCCELEEGPAPKVLQVIPVKVEWP